MKKLLPLTALALVSSVLAATPAPADCAKAISMSISSIYYTSKAAFPDQPQWINLDLREFPQGVSLCGFKFAPDDAEGRLTITASSLAAFTRLFPGLTKSTTRLAIDNFYAPEGGMGPGPKSYLMFDIESYRLIYSAPKGSTSAFALGATVDGGPIQRLYYQGKVNTIKVPRSAKSVDVYVKIDPGVFSNWRRVSLDLKGKSVTLYREAKFPAK